MVSLVHRKCGVHYKVSGSQDAIFPIWGELTVVKVYRIRPYWDQTESVSKYFILNDGSIVVYVHVLNRHCRDLEETNITFQGGAAFSYHLLLLLKFFETRWQWMRLHQQGRSLLRLLKVPL